MRTIHFGCQFYTWQMSGDRYVGKLPHILGVVNQAGFEGIEPEVCMMGSYYDDPSALTEELDKHFLRLGAMVLVCDWLNATETEQERHAAQMLFDYIEHFPGAHLVLCQMPRADRDNFAERQKNAIACINAVAARAADRGIASSFHPNSPPGSVFRIEDDYKTLLDGLDSSVVGFAPDAGHIANGGMDVLETFKTYRLLIRHVHFKDMAKPGEWAPMGKGTIDFPGIVTLLHETGYEGWIMVEEESVRAETDPDAVTVENGEYVRRTLLPIVQDPDAGGCA